MTVSRAGEFIRKLLQRGRYTFTSDEAEAALGSPRATREALHRLERRGWLFSPSQGFFVIVDPQHQTTGLPVEWFMDDWARHLGCAYYISTLTAALLHGAAHQVPQQTQVMLDCTVRTVRREGYHIAFFYKKAIPDAAWERRKSPAGYYRISLPEMTAYDLLRYPRACPSLDLAATVLTELGEHISAERLAHLPALGCELAVLQRLGWLLDQVGWGDRTGPLADALRRHGAVWYPIRPDLPRAGERDAKWHVLVNAAVEPDV
ncbi:MAG TPA: type IV toxin-antitoxin system AbiEi family antitoxin [Armatimonadota bacterium]|nr:type IV toxin-antitoxin system AbiEi family antitoxin [Armatimonadota bacterium]